MKDHGAMNLVSAKRIFGTNDGPLPRSALDWCADNWDVVSRAALAAF